MEKLAEDIRGHGLLSPIMLLDGMILDGRNRARACELAGVDPLKNAQTFTGDDPLAFVVSVNLHRRQLTLGQKSAIADQIATMQRGGARPVQDRNEQSTKSGFALSDAARMMGVSDTSVDDYRRLKREAPDLAEKVKAGEVKLGTAARHAAERAVPEREKAPDRPFEPEREAFKDPPDPLRDFMRVVIQGIPKSRHRELREHLAFSHIPVLVVKFDLAIEAFNAGAKA